VNIWSGLYKDRDVARGSKRFEGMASSRMKGRGLTESRAAVRAEMSGRSLSVCMWC
jgi:hypothetical protein